MFGSRGKMNRIGLVIAVLGALGCTPAQVAPPPKTVNRIAVLPPYNLRGDGAPAAATGDALNPRQLTVGDVLAEQARAQLAEKGFAVVDPGVVQAATKDRLPTSAHMAAQIVDAAHLDATAMYIEVRLWEPNWVGMKTDSVIVALDVMLIDPQTGAVVWQVRRDPKPVPLYGVLLTGQANVFVAETIMREVLAPLRPVQPAPPSSLGASRQ